MEAASGWTNVSKRTHTPLFPPSKIYSFIQREAVIEKIIGGSRILPCLHPKASVNLNLLNLLVIVLPTCLCRIFRKSFIYSNSVIRLYLKQKTNQDQVWLDCILTHFSSRLANTDPLSTVSSWNTVSIGPLSTWATYYQSMMVWRQRCEESLNNIT